jgi:hypothetical protein
MAEEMYADEENENMAEEEAEQDALGDQELE